MSDVTLKRADIVSMLEETKRETLKGVPRDSGAYTLIEAFAGVIECKLMMLSAEEETDG